MTTLYEIFHWHIDADEDAAEHAGEPDEKRIGPFSTEAKAKAVIRVLREKPGFRRWPGGFRIRPITVDGEDHAWKGGFVSIDGKDSPPAA